MAAITKDFLEAKIAKLKGDYDKLSAESVKLQNDAIATNGAVQMCELLLSELAKDQPVEAPKLAKVE